ncbi:MAG: VRR-NUC domain-containing protein [Myxococcales bacterium]|nr:VRR-NUC domain-containing protein [Myxococcales bacterium]
MGSPPPAPSASLAAEDFEQLLTRGLQRGQALLSAGEAQIVRRMQVLPFAAFVTYARLTARVPQPFELDRLQLPGVDDPCAAVEALKASELADHLVPWRVRAAHLPRDALVGAARTLGVATSGRKAELLQRLLDHPEPVPLPRAASAHQWLRLRHRSLVQRLARFASLEAHPDRSTPVIARLGIVRWPTYTLTDGPGPHADRRQLLCWEELCSSELSAEEALTALAAGRGAAPAGLDLRRRLRRAVRGAARELERDGHPKAAVELYRRLVDGGGERLGRVAFRWARAEEAAGAPERGLAVLQRARAHADPVERLAIARTGKRLARSLRRSWPPDPPLRAAPARHLRLPISQESPEGIEQATCSALAAVGRRAVHGEGRPWSTLFALLFADTYFLPVPGALPVPYLSGPLDLGTPAFRRRRAKAVGDVLERIRAGRAPALVRSAHARWQGTALAGARWHAADGPTLEALALGLGPRGLLTILEPILDHGRRAAAGLPDLAILPGPSVRLDDAVPGTLPEGLLLAEVKGPTDSLRDAQRVWLDRLVGAGVAAEVWHVKPATRPRSFAV